MFSLLWAVLCAVATGMFGDVFNRRVMQNWDISSDEHIQWRYKHALAVVVSSKDIFSPLLPKEPKDGAVATEQRLEIYSRIYSRIIAE